jgi:hypothetical protein
MVIFLKDSKISGLTLGVAPGLKKKGTTLLRARVLRDIRGEICLEAELHLLTWLLVDLRKKREANHDSFLAEKVLAFLSFPAVRRCAFAAGGNHTCALQADGTLVCFGYNDYGQCNVPANLGPVAAVAAGGFHTCALQADGTLV